MPLLELHGSSFYRHRRIEPQHMRRRTTGGAGRGVAFHLQSYRVRATARHASVTADSVMRAADAALDRAKTGRHEVRVS